MNRAELRLALYRRLRWLWPLLANAWARRLLKLLAVLVVLGYFAFVALILGLRYWALPQVATHQVEIEQLVSRTLGMPVRIAQIDADWRGLNPRLTLSGVQVLDKTGQPALAFHHVETVLSWRTLWHFAPIMDLLAVDGPILHIRRLSNGRITVAGVDAEGETDPRVLETLLKQRRIRIRNATIVWADEQRKAPQLVLEDVQFGLDNRGSRHLFGLSAVPPEHLASRLDLRGELHGDLLGDLNHLTGKVFAELDYADLAGWRAWVDYPFRMQHGRGALRIWGDWDEGRGGITADLALEDVQVRLGRNVPELQLASLRGRVQGRYGQGEWSVAGKKIELSTLSGIRMPPTDFDAEWKEGERDADEPLRLSGSANATMLDFETLRRLAAYLPLDARSRELLAIHEPRGRLSDLRTSWEVHGDTIKRYVLKGRFDGLGINAHGVFPGGKGLSGEVEANEAGGTLLLAAHDGGIDLPSVFPASFIALSELRARASWKIDGKVVDLDLERLDFKGPDADGLARGTYRYSGDGPGVVDLTASVSRADGRAAWRYLPHSVGNDTRNWMRDSIVEGGAGDAKLTLRGDLRHFPFRDPEQGIFLITAKAKGVRIDYAKGWPLIEGLDADMRFGVGMRLESTAGNILGARFDKVVAVIPDFDVPEEWLHLQGAVDGPTAAFLKFIDQSPVAEITNRFTEPMRAQGDGRLEMKMDMPLRNIDATKLRGEYSFVNNQVTVAPGLPPISQVNGKFNFTESSITAPALTGQLLGAPLRLSAKNEGSNVQVNMTGGATSRELRRVFNSPVLDHVSGSAAWKGSLVVRKKTADFVIESNLVGLSSSLPEPFNKTAAASLPLRLEKSELPSAADGKEREQLRLNIKSLAEAVLQRRDGVGGMALERGAFAVGAALPELPAVGLAGDIQLARVDGDFWRRALGGGTEDAAPAAVAVLPNVQRLNVRTPSLRLFNRDFNGVDLAVSTRNDAWQVGLTAREAVGEIVWQGQGKGNLRADFKRLAIPAEALESGARATNALVDSLPAMDIRVADLTFGDKRLGRLEAKARNHITGWQLDNLLVQNPDGSLKGKGDWQVRGGQQTLLEFELTAIDAGKLLERLGYPNAVRRGSALLTGNLRWNGPLTTIHYPSLSGEMNLKAEKGQFNKLEPGIGKLLGLISLQSLPRRLTLDFRDIFSDGLAFDSIESKLAVKQGVMSTVDDLKIDGPAARILIRGDTDLKQETQNLRVDVQPEVGGAAAVGIAIANPAIGAAAWVVNKVLQNPLNRMFAFQYHVTGSWSDPKVEKVEQAAVPEAAVEKGSP